MREVLRRPPGRESIWPELRGCDRYAPRIGGAAPSIQPTGCEIVMLAMVTSEHFGAQRLHAITHCAHVKARLAACGGCMRCRPTSHVAISAHCSEFSP